MTVMKILLERFHDRLGIVEGEISEQEDKAIETIQNKTKREKDTQNK